MSQRMGNVLFSVLWLLILLFVAFWVASFCCGFYIILLPFTACIDGISGLTDMLLQGVQFPHYCAVAMVEGRGF